MAWSTIKFFRIHLTYRGGYLGTALLPVTDDHDLLDIRLIFSHEDLHSPFGGYG